MVVVVKDMMVLVLRDLRELQEPVQLALVVWLKWAELVEQMAHLEVLVEIGHKMVKKQLLSGIVDTLEKHFLEVTMLCQEHSMEQRLKGHITHNKYA
jgi:hypothetical protein